MLATAALLASCSQDDALQNTVNNNEGLKPMTITASLPTDGMQTRAQAEGDAAAARCYVQILKGDGTELEDNNSDVKKMTLSPDGTFTTTVYLNGNETYDFLFWADTEAATDQNAPADLTAVDYTNGQTIAWAGSKDNETWTSQGVNMELTHIVSRVTVMTESKFEASDAWPLTVTVPTVYNKYNVAEGKVVAGTTVANGYTFEAANRTYNNGDEVGHFYVLGDGNTQKLGLHYDGPLENPAIDITEVPVSANTHITLTGDIYHAGLVLGNIKATVSEDWPNSSNKPF